MAKCNVCGSKIVSMGTFCPVCDEAKARSGYQPREKSMSRKCPGCNTELTALDNCCPVCLGDGTPRPPKEPMSPKVLWGILGAGVMTFALVAFAVNSGNTKKCLTSCDSVASYCDLRASTVFQQIVCREDARACRERCER